jgi:hypothetical protein
MHGSVRYWCEAISHFSRSQARWEADTARTILRRRKKFLFISALPILLCIGLQAAAAADVLPEKIPILGGSKAYMPSFASTKVFLGSILVGLIAGLITGVIGAGGGYILTPALMSFGVRGIMAVGTDQFHLFAKAIMGTTIHRKMGNVNFGLAAFFVLGSLVGVTIGGTVNRAVFQYSPTLSDALISTVYVIVLGLLGFYAIADWRRLRRQAPAQRSSVEATTAFAKRLQALHLRPRVTFDRNIVPGGRTIPIYPVIGCGLVVGFVASIMGVGGGFLTFPMFVYGLGVSTFTTVGTDLLQIIFTTSYSSIFQYAIYGFVFYTVSIGMLLGSLIGVQIGAMVTKMVKGARIRVFYALTILAGFANRLFALPRKLADLGYVSLSRESAVAIETTGTVLFFTIVGIFALWVVAVFLRNVRAIRAAEVGHRPDAGGKLIVNRGKFALGLGGLVAFVAALAVALSPALDNRTGLGRADDFFNQLAKNSAYYTPEGRKLAGRFAAEPVDLAIRPREPVANAKLAQIVTANGLEARLLEDGSVRVTGSLGELSRAAMDDADLAFRNENAQLEAKYRMSSCEVVYCWWIVLDSLSRRYTQDNRSPEADFTKFLATKVLEPAYNFRGITAQNVEDRVLPVSGLLGFYVLYTLWYGFAILFIFEGLGLSATEARQKKEA